jgi:hypothetical protein
MGRACSVLNGHVDLVVADAIGAAPLTIAGNPMLHLAEPNQSLDIDVE